MAELALAGTVLSAVGSIQQGRAARSASNFQAKQLEQRAKVERAVSQRQAIEQKRQIDLAQGRARTLAGAGGTALASPTVTNILGGLGAEADYAFNSEISGGENRARGTELGAATAKAEGKQAQRAGMFEAAGKLGTFAAGSSGESLFEKYGGGSQYTVFDESSSTPWIKAGETKPWYMR